MNFVLAFLFLLQFAAPFQQSQNAQPATATIEGVVAGQTLKDVVFHLLPGGTVTGRVQDATGAVLAGMTVQLVQPSYDSNGKRSFQPRFFGRTDDRGEYRLYWITPGRYYLNVSSNPMIPMYPPPNEVI